MPKAETVEVPLTQGYVAIIDAEDAERILAHKWHIKRSRRSKRLYVQRTVNLGGGKKTAVTLHREVMRAQVGEIVDHRDGDPFNNRKKNLRRCTSRQNQQNVTESANQRRGGFKGVYRSASGRWCAAIGAGEKRPSGKRKRVHLGSFDTPEEAAAAYDLAAVEHFGEFAALNFPERRPDYEEELQFRAAVVEHAARMAVLNA